MNKKKKSSSEYEIYKIFKVKCYPTKKQREFIDINLDGVYFVRNLYIKFNEKRCTFYICTPYSSII